MIRLVPTELLLEVGDDSVGVDDEEFQLRDLRQVNLSGVIAGKALYERKFTVAEAQAALDGKG